MANLNCWYGMGRLTKDPEVKLLQNGSTVCNMTLAASRNYKNKDGERQEDTLFIDMVAWNKLAEICEQYGSKGQEVLVEGRIELDQWEDRETGQKRQKHRVVLDRFQFIGNLRNRDDENRGNRYEERRAVSSRSNSKYSKDDDWDDAPF